jgi:hypothetical protein
MATYRVDHHGTSGTWYPSCSGLKTLLAAFNVAQSIKSDSYGVRIVDDRERVILSAPWQIELPPFCGLQATELRAVLLDCLTQYRLLLKSNGARSLAFSTDFEPLHWVSARMWSPMDRACGLLGVTPEVIDAELDAIITE